MKRRIVNCTRMAWALQTVIALGIGIYHSRRGDTLILDWDWVKSGIPSDIEAHARAWTRTRRAPYPPYFPVPRRTLTPRRR